VIVNNRFSGPQFKGWTKPGPVISPPDDLEIGPGETLDAISGYFRLFQLKKGHRFSTDDVLTAWYGTSWCPRAERVLDLGSGIGSVGMIAAWRLPGAKFVTIEAQEESVRLARKSARYNRIDERYEIRLGDFRDPTVLRPDEKFDLVLGSPPYFPQGTGVEGDHPQKIACRFELRGNIEHYCETAARALTPGGLFACVFPTNQLSRCRTHALNAGLSAIRRRAVVFREGEDTVVTRFAMIRSTDQPAAHRPKTYVEPPLIIRRTDGSVHPEYQAVKLSFGFPP
jgi:tRNA1Val (adenine37-N6)-methyltransferase